MERTLGTVGQYFWEKSLDHSRRLAENADPWATPRFNLLILGPHPGIFILIKLNWFLYRVQFKIQSSRELTAEATGLWNQTQSLTACVTVDKLLHLPHPWSLVYNWDTHNNIICFGEVLEDNSKQSTESLPHTAQPTEILKNAKNYYYGMQKDFKLINLGWVMP